MSDNKLRYYRVTQTSVVTAKSKTDAVAIARGRRGVTGRILGQTGETVRLPAAEAKEEAGQKTMTA